MHKLFSILALLVLAGCPDPAATTDPNAPGANPPQPYGENNPQPGQPGEGAPGQPGQPSEGAPGNAEPGPNNTLGSRPTPAGFNVPTGQGVKLSGKVTFDGSAKGVLKIDFLRNPEGSPFPELLHSLQLSGPGDWSVEAPKDIGEISIVAFIDADENGPTPGEPMALYKDQLKIEKADIADINLELSTTPDMGMFAPRNGGGAGQGTPPEGAPSGPGATPPGEGGAPPGAPGTTGNPGADAPPVATPPAGDPPPAADPAGEGSKAGKNQ